MWNHWSNITPNRHRLLNVLVWLQWVGLSRNFYESRRKVLCARVEKSQSQAEDEQCNCQELHCERRWFHAYIKRQRNKRLLRENLGSLKSLVHKSATDEHQYPDNSLTLKHCLCFANVVKATISAKKYQFQARISISFLVENELYHNFNRKKRLLLILNPIKRKMYAQKLFSESPKTLLT